MNSATQRVQTYLEQHGKHFTVKEMPDELGTPTEGQWLAVAG